MQERLQQLAAVIDDVLLGKPEVIRLSLACLLARGHLLIEDLPGLGKTTLAHALAKVLGLDYQRIQFTSDMLPGIFLAVPFMISSSPAFVCIKARCLPSCCWQMKLTVPHPRPRAPCWKQWKNGRCRWTASAMLCRKCFCHRDPEPH